jgi:hypothetical protein
MRIGSTTARPREWGNALTKLTTMLDILETILPRIMAAHSIETEC